MSKRFKDKICTYCGSIGASNTGDHVFAREFFPESRRANLPKVPACEPCNRSKSEMEHYLTTVLPFASQHPGANKLLVSKTPGRLARNMKLHRELAEGYGGVLAHENGVLSPRLTVPFEHRSLTALFRMVLRGLVAYHWQVHIPQDYFVGAGTMAKAGDQFMRQLFIKNANQHVAVDLGDGLILYEGVQAVDNRALTIWRFQLYGGTQFGGDPQTPNETTSDIWALSAPTPIPYLFD